MSVEAKVGAFVSSALLLMFMLSTQVNDLGNFNDKGIKVHAYIQDASGLEKKSKVKMNGVEIGYIEDISLDAQTVKLRFFIQEGIQIPVDSSIMVTQDNVLGGKLINISSGNSKSYLKEDESFDKICTRLSSFDETSDGVNKAAEEVRLFMVELRQTFDADSRKDLQDALREFSEVGRSLRVVIAENRKNMYETFDNFNTMGQNINQKLPTILERIDSMTARFDRVGGTLDKKLPVALDKFISLEDQLSGILDENGKPLSQTLASADNFFQSGEKTFSKVDKLLSTFTKSELQFGVNAHYMLSDEYIKTYADINYLPNPSTYYMASIILTDDYTNSDSNGDFIEPQTHDKSEYYFSAQYGKRYDDLLFRAGLIESTAGFGLDYFMYRDNVKFSLEAFDWNAQNDFRDDSAHMKFSLRYRFYKHAEVYAGWDNFINDKADNIYLGFGASFTEESMKYLLGSAAGSAL